MDPREGPTGRFKELGRTYLYLPSPALVPLLVLVAATGLYWFTGARSPGWMDAAAILSGARKLELGAAATKHNLFSILGHVWLTVTPFLDPHRSLTLLCGLFGSLTALFTFLAARDLTGNGAAAALAAAALALSQSLWWHSTMVEVYSLNTVLIAAILFLVFRFLERKRVWLLSIAFLAWGLGVSNHLLMGLYAPAFVVLVVMLLAQRELRARHVLVMLLCASAGASLYLFALAREIARDGLLPALRTAAGDEYLALMFPRGLPGRERLFWALNYVFLVLLNFPSAAIVFAFRGLPALWLRKPGPAGAIFFLTGLGAQVIWSANYLIFDMYAFSLPVYVMLAAPLSLGMEAFLRRRRINLGRSAVLLALAFPLVLYPSFARWPCRARTVDRYIAMYPESSHIGGWWDPASYLLNSVKRWQAGPEPVAAAWAALLPPDAHYWDDTGKGYYPFRFYYQEIRGIRRDVTLHNLTGALIDEAAAQAYAEQIQQQLDSGDVVVVSSLGEPERIVLNHLYRLHAPQMAWDPIRSMSSDELTRSFPGVRIRALPLLPDGSITIYRLEAAGP